MTEVRHLMRRLIVYYTMRLLITIRDRHGASLYAFRRLVLVWPAVLALTVAALWLTHDILWNTHSVPVERAVSIPAPPMAPVEHVDSVPTPHPSQAATAHRMGDAFVSWTMRYAAPVMAGAGVLVAGLMLIMGHHGWPGIIVMAAGAFAISQWSTVTDFLVPTQHTEQFVHEQPYPSRPTPDCQLIWFGASGAWMCK